MKRLAYFLLGLTILFVGCQPKNTEQNILPASFRISIPKSLSSSQPPEQKIASDTLKASELYNYLRYFIHVGDNAASIVQDVINKLHQYDLGENINFSFTGDDGHVKNVTVKALVPYEGKNWDYALQITDADMESKDDDGIAMQLYWNLNPVEGVAIIKPSNMDTQAYSYWGNAMVRIDYSEAEPVIYDRYMEVSATNLPLDTADRYSVSNLKLFVGQKSPRTDVYGNTQHPNAWILLPEHKGYDWAFVASSLPTEGIAAAEVGLPPDSINTSSRQILLEDYSLYNVLKQEIRQWYYQQYGVYPDSLVLEQYLANAKGPAHFTNKGFLPSNLAINPMFKDLESFIKNLCPYNPYDIATMEIKFGPFPTER